jgi:anti-anti-sigma factor
VVRSSIGFHVDDARSDAMATNDLIGLESPIEVDRGHVDVSIVRLRGEHDLSSAEHVRDTIEAELAFCGSVVVDLRRTLFIDSTIIRTFFHAAKKANNGRNRLALCVATEPSVARVLQLTQAATEIPTYRSEDVAIEAVRLT